MNSIKPYQANLINFTAMVFIGLWSYSSTHLNHALIIPAIGILLSAFHKQMKAGENLAKNIVIIITALNFISLFMPLERVISTNDIMGIMRMSLLILINLFALVVYYLNYKASKTNQINKIEGNDI
jgi:hypothetical protein